MLLSSFGSDALVITPGWLFLNFGSSRFCCSLGWGWYGGQRWQGAQAAGSFRGSWSQRGFAMRPQTAIKAVQARDLRFACGQRTAARRTLTLH